MIFPIKYLSEPCQAPRSRSWVPQFIKVTTPSVSGTGAGDGTDLRSGTFVGEKYHHSKYFSFSGLGTIFQQQPEKHVDNVTQQEG